MALFAGCLQTTLTKNSVSAFTIVCIAIISTAYCQSDYVCPSDDWSPCAKNGDYCKPAQGISAGYISFCSVNGQCNLNYFVNNKSSTDTSWKISCEGKQFGDPEDGKTKYCCYKSIESNTIRVGFNWWGETLGPFGLRKGYWNENTVGWKQWAEHPNVPFVMTF